MTVTHRRRQALVIFGGFGIVIPNLLMGLLIGNPRPAIWPLSAKIVAVGIALNALVIVIFPVLLESEE